MENENQTTPRKQLCTIRVMFPVTTDEEAIDIKKKVSSELADIPEARIEFSLSNLTR